MRRALWLSGALLAHVAVALTAFGQFAIRVEQDGRVFSTTSGSTLTFNSPALGQPSTAVVTFTYVGADRATFPFSPQLFGNGDFTISTINPPVVLSPLQSATITLTYNPRNPEVSVSQLSWGFELTPAGGLQNGQSPVPGLISLNMAGTVPAFVVSSVQADGNYQALSNGGKISFPETLLNSNSDVTISIINRGSGPGIINSLNLTGDGFQLLGLPLLPFTLNANSELRVLARFLPRSAGIKTGSLQVAFANGTSFTASLEGTSLTTLFSYELVRDGAISPLAVGEPITVPETKVGERSFLVVRFRNLATTAAVLNNIIITGPPFFLTEGPFLPVVLQPQEVKSVKLTYAPTEPGESNGSLLIGNDTFVISSKGLGPLLRYSYQVNSADNAVVPGGAVSFPPVVFGQTGTLQFTVTNRGTSPTSLVSIGILDTQGIFRLRDLPALPAELAADGQLRFAVDFSPKAAGQTTTTLLLDGLSFTLVGFSSAAPALPSYSFTGASGRVGPFEQPAFGLRLAETYPLALRGIITLSVIPDNFVIDPAVQFATGGRQVAFTIPANSRDAVFPNGATQMQLQTGTVAGTLQLEPAFVSESGSDLTPANPTRQRLEVPRLAPALLSARLGARSATGLSVVVTGYVTSRALDRLEFEFRGDGSFGITSTRVTVRVASEAQVWFQSAAGQSVGGQFAIEVPFTLRATGGDGSVIDLTGAIQSIAVTAVNDLGNSGTLQIPVP